MITRPDRFLVAGRTLRGLLAGSALLAGLAACASSRTYSDIELMQKAARGDVVHCWKRQHSESGPLCSEPGYEAPLRDCLAQTGRTDWPVHSLALAPGAVLACMAEQGWHHARLTVTMGGE